ncbi:MAG: hypothetical protein ACFE8J_02565 [Candidatus Heimdallarchaeota archaeon]
MIEQRVNASFCFLLYFFIGIFVIIPLATILTNYNIKKSKNNVSKNGVR